MKAPSRDSCDFCVAHWAESALFMPEIAKSMSTPKRVQHVISLAFLEVGFICRIIRVSFASDFNVPFDGYATSEQQPNFTGLPLFVTCFSEEEPVTSPVPLKVFLFEPTRGFIRVSSSCPLPQTVDDCVVNAVKCAFTRCMPMIVCPAPDFGVEFLDQIGGRHAKCGFNRPSDLIQECLDVFLGWFNEQFPIGVSAHMLSEEVKAVRHVRDDRLRGREFKPSFLQKLRDEWFDLSFQ